MISQTALAGFTVPMTWTFIDRLEVGHLHLRERLVPQDAGVGDQDVDAPRCPWSA
jgi:hypothetical protein